VRKKLVIAALVFFGSLIAVGIWLVRDERRLNAKYQVRPTETTTPVATPVQWIHISAKDLSDEYVVNSMAANQKYRSQYLVVTGLVDQVSVREGGRSFVSLFASGLETIQCQMKAGDESTAARLRHAERVEVRGLCNGNDELKILLSDCSITKQ
jgi:hypothetical protein